jgi:agmatinase
MKFLEKPKNLFIGAQPTDTIVPNACQILGFRFDGTSCFRKGADKGPDAIRDVSDSVEDYSSYLDKSLEDQVFYDLGNLPHFPDNWEKTNDYFNLLTEDVNPKEKKVRLLTLGGEHSISYGPISYYLKHFPDMALLHLDAHADLRDGYQGFKYSHASIMFRIQEHLTDKNELIQYGIRSGTREEFMMAKEKGWLALGREDFLKRVKKIADHRPIYLTLDLDYFDPGMLPGTGTPEAGGEDFHSFISLMKILKDKNFVGADVVELAPELDPTGISASMATKVVREILLAFNLR